jgi:hypothetical protein
MASPRRIYRVYARLAEVAGDLGDMLLAKGEKLSGTLTLLRARDPAKPLARWGEEMQELCGVLDGSHSDPYLMEATQCFYWGALYGALRGARWEDLRFDENRRVAATCGIQTVPELRAAAIRLSGLPVDLAKPEKLFLLWNVADRLYRMSTPDEKQWSLEQLMEADFQEMRKRPYLEPILKEIGE